MNEPSAALLLDTDTSEVMDQDQLKKVECIFTLNGYVDCAACGVRAWLLLARLDWVRRMPVR